MTAESIITKSIAKSYDSRGTEVGVVELPAGVFAGPVKKELVHGVVRWQRARARAGTHSVLTRSEIVGGKKKPFKQKGTGHARAGSSVSPLMVGGAVVHGPTPRSYAFSIPRKMRQGALRSALSVRGRAESVVVLENLDGVTGKTKQAIGLLEAIGVAGKKVLVILPNSKSEACGLIKRALGNIRNVVVLPVQGVNVYDVINSERIVVIKSALPELEARTVA